MTEKLKNLRFSHFEQICKNGYTLDIVYILLLAENDVDVRKLCGESVKLKTLFQTVVRKGLITDEGKLTLSGKAVIAYLDEANEDDKLVKLKMKTEGFDKWWKSYPGTDNFTHNGRTFKGSRTLRQNKEECRLKFNKIIEEGEYTEEQLISALEYDVLQKKTASAKNNTNKLTFMQNSLTYLNQRTFEPIIELMVNGIEDQQETVGSTDI